MINAGDLVILNYKGLYKLGSGSDKVGVVLSVTPYEKDLSKTTAQIYWNAGFTLNERISYLKIISL